MASSPGRSGTWLFYLAFFLSGAAGLGYEVVWTRLFSTALGHEYPSLLAVVAAFFGGVALGAWAADRAISRSQSPGRVYALLEAVRVGTPPRLLASYYLDQGRFQPEPVTEELLFSAVARVTDGIARILDARRRDREPRTAAGPACRWCPVLGDCDTGRRHLDDDALDGW